MSLNVLMLLEKCINLHCIQQEDLINKTLEASS